MLFRSINILSTEMATPEPTEPDIVISEKRSLFKEKVVVVRETIDDVKADCFINFCCPNIHSGVGYFGRVHDKAGPELANVCEKYIGAAPTSSRATPAFEASGQFKFFVHTIVPTPLDMSRMIDIKKFYACVRNSLNMAIEEGAKIIAFPSYFPGVSCRVASELVLRIFTVWIHRSPYSEKLRELKICCQSEQEFHQFVQAARALYEEANIIGHLFVPAFVQQRQAYCRRLNRSHTKRRLIDVHAPPNTPQVKLELSAKLAPTILVIDDEEGMKRQYRLTNKSRDGRKLYFRCSRCDTLIKKDGILIRAKLIVEDGEIVSEQFPEHHPECKGNPIEKVLVQQVDRTSRREVRDGFLMPQDAYRKALDRMRVEAADLGLPVEECFPEWPKLRQQYCRIRKQAVRQRQQEKWEWMMMARGAGLPPGQHGDLANRLFGEDAALTGTSSFFYYQDQVPRKRGRPRKDSLLLADHDFMPTRMRYSPTQNGVVLNYDDGGEIEEEAIAIMKNYQTAKKPPRPRRAAAAVAMKIVEENVQGQREVREPEDHDYKPEQKHPQQLKEQMEVEEQLEEEEEEQDAIINVDEEEEEVNEDYVAYGERFEEDEQMMEMEEDEEEEEEEE